MTRAEWYTSTDPAAMLRHVEGKVSNRKLRLWCYTIAEIDGLKGFWRGSQWEHGEVDTTDCFNAPQIIAEGWSTHLPTPPPAVKAALLRCVVGDPWQEFAVEKGPMGDSVYWQVSYSTALMRTKDLRPGCYRVKRNWLTWEGGTVPKLAERIYQERIYQERRFEDTPILADALEEAGADCVPLLMHLRGREMCPRCCGRGELNYTTINDPSSGWVRCSACNGSGYRPRDPLVWCRGDWAIDLLTGRS